MTTVDGGKKLPEYQVTYNDGSGVYGIVEPVPLTDVPGITTINVVVAECSSLENAYRVIRGLKLVDARPKEGEEQPDRKGFVVVEDEATGMQQPRPCWTCLVRSEGGVSQALAWLDDNKLQRENCDDTCLMCAGTPKPVVTTADDPKAS